MTIVPLAHVPRVNKDVNPSWSTYSHPGQMLKYRFTAAGNQIHKQWQWTHCRYHGETIGPTCFPIFSEYQVLVENKPRGSGRHTNTSSLWYSQVWFPRLLESLMNDPIFLPDIHNIMTDRQLRTPASIPGSLTTRCLAHIRQTFSTRGLSKGVITILSKSWWTSTELIYSSAWRQWSDRWGQRGLHPVSAPLKEILELLFSQFQAGKQYWTLNTICSATSMTHERWMVFACGPARAGVQVYEGNLQFQPRGTLT